MVRESNTFARTLAEWASGRSVPPDVELRTRDQSYSEIQPPEYRADLVIEFVRGGTQRPVSIMILEVQLTRDADKKRTWPAYQAVLRAQYRCPTSIVVLAPDADVARWCAEPIDLDGRGQSVIRPSVIGPDQVPLVTSVVDAVRTPSIATLSVIAHGRTRHALEVGRAGLAAAYSLDEPDGRLYADVVLHHLETAARQALEREMALKLKNKYEYESVTFRRLVAEGEVKGKRGALHAVLEARGFHVDDATKARIEACRSAGLDALVVRAATIAALDELFDS